MAWGWAIEKGKEVEKMKRRIPRAVVIAALCLLAALCFLHTIEAEPAEALEPAVA